MKKSLMIFAVASVGLFSCSSEAEEPMESVSTELVDQLSEEEKINEDVQKVNDDLDKLLEEI